MAVAALEVLGLTDRIAEVLDPSEFVPAVGQGCVAVECRDDDRTTRNALRSIDHEPTRRAVTIERAFLAELGSGLRAARGRPRRWQAPAHVPRRPRQRRHRLRSARARRATTTMSIWHAPRHVSAHAARHPRMTTEPLAGKRVVTTRDEPGLVDRMLDGGRGTRRARAADPDRRRRGRWGRAAPPAPPRRRLPVVDRHVAARRSPGRQGRCRHRGVRLGCGRAPRRPPSCRRSRSGRSTWCPPVQTGAGLLAAMPRDGRGCEGAAGAGRSGRHRAGGRAEPSAATTSRRWSPIAPRCAARPPPSSRAALAADAVAFASGSAVQGWVDAIGFRTPRCVVAIGPSTAAFADELGLRITHVAADHSVPGLVAEIVRALAPSP